MPENNLSAVFLSTIFFGFLRAIMKKLDERRERAALLIAVPHIRPACQGESGLAHARFDQRASDTKLSY